MLLNSLEAGHSLFRRVWRNFWLSNCIRMSAALKVAWQPHYDPLDTDMMPPAQGRDFKGGKGRKGGGQALQKLRSLLKNFVLL